MIKYVLFIKTLFFTKGQKHHRLKKTPIRSTMCLKGAKIVYITNKLKIEPQKIIINCS